VKTNPSSSGMIVEAVAQGTVRLMRISAGIALLCFGLAVELRAQQEAVLEEGRTRFCAVDIFIDSGSTPLAAYQLEFTVTNGVAKIVGIEGGEHPAFRQPPFYDPKAIQRERAILASFSTAPAEELPKGNTRVATVHLQTTRRSPPGFTVRLQTVASPGGNKITGLVSFEERKIR
jgi:hypothetical protein